MGDEIFVDIAQSDDLAADFIGCNDLDANTGLERKPSAKLRNVFVARSLIRSRADPLRTGPPEVATRRDRLTDRNPSDAERPDGCARDPRLLHCPPPDYWRRTL